MAFIKKKSGASPPRLRLRARQSDFVYGPRLSPMNETERQNELSRHIRETQAAATGHSTKPQLAKQLLRKRLGVSLNAFSEKGSLDVKGYVLPFDDSLKETVAIHLSKSEIRMLIDDAIRTMFD